MVKCDVRISPRPNSPPGQLLAGSEAAADREVEGSLVRQLDGGSEPSAGSGGSQAQAVVQPGLIGLTQVLEKAERREIRKIN